MTNQKDLWRQEKEQMKRDKLNQPREVRKREVPLSLGAKKTKPKIDPPAFTPDEVLRKRLGI